MFQADFFRASRHNVQRELKFWIRKLLGLGGGRQHDGCKDYRTGVKVDKEGNSGDVYFAGGAATIAGMGLPSRARRYSASARMSSSSKFMR